MTSETQRVSTTRTGSGATRERTMRATPSEATEVVA
jgi:hypothetical protein